MPPSAHTAGPPPPYVPPPPFAARPLTQGERDAWAAAEYRRAMMVDGFLVGYAQTRWVIGRGVKWLLILLAVFVACGVMAMMAAAVVHVATTPASTPASTTTTSAP